MARTLKGGAGEYIIVLRRAILFAREILLPDMMLELDDRTQTVSENFSPGSI